MSSVPKPVSSKLPIKAISVIRRRSNSFSDLSRVDHQVKQTKSTAPKSGLNTRLRNIQNIELPIRHPARAGLRKSKSFVDLRKLHEVEKTVSVKPAGSTMKGFKRQNTITSETITKKGKLSPPKSANKVPKQAKPPPYDFKARYTILLEKYKTLKESDTKQKQQLNEITNDLQEADVHIDTLKSDKENMEKVCNLQHTELFHAKNKLKELERNVAENLQQLKEANIQIQNLRAEKENLQQAYDLQCAELFQVKSTVNEQLDDIKTYKSKLEELKAQICEYSKAEVLYKDALYKAEKTRKYMHNCIQELKGNIQVFCRVRPTDLEYLECNINYLNEKTLEIKKSKESISAATGKICDLKLEFSFDRIYPPQAQQQEIFNELSPLVQSAIDGYHVCVFAYGQTGSGKTYTMQGSNNHKQQGMIPRSITLLFDAINQVERSDTEYQIQASFLEIYNEMLRDLLKPDSKEKLSIQYNEGKGVIVPNLTIAPVENEKQLVSLMESANINRAVAATDFNEHSSRSHAITKIYIKCFDKSTQSIYKGSLNFVDLAGSESAKTSSSERLCETKNINKSLSALGTVMLALHNKNSHIPYRNSKLTYLLQSCLGGNSKTLMFLNISPLEECYSETLNSLRFATTIKHVKTESRRNKTYAKESD